MDIRVTQPDDLPALATFLAAQGLQTNTDVLRWKFPPDATSPPRSWVAVLDGEIVGHIGVIPTAVSVAGQRHTPSQHVRGLPDTHDIPPLDHYAPPLDHYTLPLDKGGQGGVPESYIHASKKEPPFVPPCQGGNHDRPATYPFRAGWFVDWMVREDLRSRGIGIFLLREALANGSILMTIQGSADTRKALPQLGWSCPAMLPLYKLNIQPPAAGSGLLRQCAANVAQRLWFHPVQHRPPPDWQLLTDDETPDATWAQLSDALQRLDNNSALQVNYLPRSATFLRWWLGEHPTRRYHFLIASDSTGPGAYAIWRTARHPAGRIEGRIVDLAAPWDRPDIWTWLVSETTTRLAQAGASQACCLAGPHTPLATALRQNRFLVRQQLPLWISPTDQFPAHTPWHATLADSDIDTAAEV